ncbi:MAG: ribosomal RNA small subunit methyltransferase A [Candidatus Omnitrophica bacterium]|nr:ribosomal RNA small subunit methyltransferase A [Candidatus Omnitrophota bacterium]
MNPKHLLNDAGLRPVKSLGQHFLSSPSRIRSIIESASLGPGQVIEIGPGLGALTDALIELPVKLILIEKDPKLVALLKERYAAYAESIRIQQGDFLDYTFEDILVGSQCVVLGNLPYYVSSPILFHLLEHRAKIKHAVVTVQREVAERLLAKPNTKDYGRLTLSFGLHAEVKRLFDIRRNEFYPQPKVISTVLFIRFKDAVDLPAGVSEELYLKVVKLAFGKRRKQIANALCHNFPEGWPRALVEEALTASKLSLKVRAEVLSPEEFSRLSSELAERGVR